MENSILTNGCTVKALRDTEGTAGMLVKGQKYAVKSLSSGGLGIETPTGLLPLTNADGTLTDACDDVRLIF